MAKAKSNAGRELVLGGYRGHPQQRKGRPTDWSQAKRDKFIEALADSCNVSLAARAINRSAMSTSSARPTPSFGQPGIKRWRSVIRGSR
jgi:hypothetical protein